MLVPFDSSFLRLLIPFFLNMSTGASGNVSFSRTPMVKSAQPLLFGSRRQLLTGSCVTLVPPKRISCNADDAPMSTAGDHSAKVPIRHTTL